jgi:hypothetical protein
MRKSQITSAKTITSVDTVCNTLFATAINTDVLNIRGTINQPENAVVVSTDTEQIAVTYNGDVVCSSLKLTPNTINNINANDIYINDNKNISQKENTGVEKRIYFEPIIWENSNIVNKEIFSNKTLDIIQPIFSFIYFTQPNTSIDGWGIFSQPSSIFDFSIKGAGTLLMEKTSNLTIDLFISATTESPELGVLPQTEISIFYRPDGSQPIHLTNFGTAITSIPNIVHLPNFMGTNTVRIFGTFYKNDELSFAVRCVNAVKSTVQKVKIVIFNNK